MKVPKLLENQLIPVIKIIMYTTTSNFIEIMEDIIRIPIKAVITVAITIHFLQVITIMDFTIVAMLVVLVVIQVTLQIILISQPRGLFINLR